MFMVLSSWPKSLRQFTRFIWWMQTERRVAANPQTKPIDLGCESAENWQLPSTSTVAIFIITQPVSWYSFYRPTKGRRLSRPKHCSEGAQPVLKTVYRSSCRDKHNCQRRDSNLDPLTPQSDAPTTRLLKDRKQGSGTFRAPLPFSGLIRFVRRDAHRRRQVELMCVTAAITLICTSTKLETRQQQSCFTNANSQTARQLRNAVFAKLFDKS